MGKLVEARRIYREAFDELKAVENTEEVLHCTRVDVWLTLESVCS